MDVIIIGAGGHGRVVLDILRAAGSHKPIGFVDADPQLAGTSIGGLSVLGQANLLPKLKNQKIKAAIVAVGDNRARRSYAKKLLEQGFELINAIHPNSSVSPTAKLGRNVVVAAGAVIGTDSLIADDVIINTSAVVDHECEIGQAVHVCPAAALAGRVRVGEEAFIGLGCRIIQCLTIGPQSVVGAGAVVIADVPEGATVVGVPARVIKVHPESLAHAVM
jgi:UDP-perosamine 4-acetyltransferase